MLSLAFAENILGVMAEVSQKITVNTFIFHQVK